MMDYTGCLKYLNAISEKYGICYGLDIVTKLFEKAYNPRIHTKVIHVAGTNGKGSVSSFIAYILSAAGYKVGRYISPAVYGYREKIQYIKNGCVKYITEEEVSRYINTLKGYADAIYEEHNAYPSIFEMETVMAFMAFDDWQCDYAVVECGMGGVLDATNAVRDKELCVFTSISEDHMAYLGNTLSDIACSKAGIMRSHVNAVSAQQNEDVKDVLLEYADSVHCRLVFTGEYHLTDTGMWGSSFEYGKKDWMISLCGRHQVENAALAIEAVHALSDIGENISDEIIRKGLLRTRWPGRFEVINTSPYVIADGAHNPDAVFKLMDSVDVLFPRERYKRIGIIGIFKDKDIDNIINNISGRFEKLHTVTPPGPRGLKAGQLADIINRNTKTMPCVHPDKGVYEVADDIINKMDTDDLEKSVIIIFGSLSLLGKN